MRWCTCRPKGRTFEARVARPLCSLFPDSVPPCVSPGKWHIAETITIVGRRRRRRSRGLTFPIEISHSSDGAATRRSVQRLHCMALARASAVVGVRDAAVDRGANRMRQVYDHTKQTFPKKSFTCSPSSTPVLQQRKAIQEETRVGKETRVTLATYSPGL